MLSTWPVCLLCYNDPLETLATTMLLRNVGYVLLLVLLKAFHKDAVTNLFCFSSLKGVA